MGFRYWLPLLIFMPALLARADDQTCTIKGMKCEACVATIKEKLCGDRYSVCEVQVGRAHLVTRNRKEHIKVGDLNHLIETTSYTVENCKTTSRPN